jgi:hypothetical protein
VRAVAGPHPATVDEDHRGARRRGPWRRIDIEVEQCVPGRTVDDSAVYRDGLLSDVRYRVLHVVAGERFGIVASASRDGEDGSPLSMSRDDASQWGFAPSFAQHRS